MAKATFWIDIDTEAKAWGQTGLDNSVVHAVNDDNQPLVIQWRSHALSYPPGSTAAGKLK